jgi:ubiquinone/menaquinone biosynthesis C-methylase UbiE
VGCGFGRLSPTFAAFSDSHVAIDVNLEALIDAHLCYPFLFAQGSGTSLPFGDSSFNFITTWTVLQHIRPTLVQQATAEIKRVATPDAILLICEASRFPDVQRHHIWDRSPEFYAAAVGARIRQSFFIDELDRIDGDIVSPGEVSLMTLDGS